MKDPKELTDRQLYSLFSSRYPDGNFYYLTLLQIKKHTVLLYDSPVRKKALCNEPLFQQIIKYLWKLGFKEIKGRSLYLKLGLYIAPEYIESVKNMLDLIISEVSENNELGYILFQEIRNYSTQTK